MQEYSASPIEMLAAPWRHRALLRRLVVRDVVGRYRGSIGGLAWSLLNPLLMLAVYAFVFGTVFKARWAIGTEGHTQFALALFAGMIVFGVFSECANRAPMLVANQPNLVKKVVFPLELMPWVALLSALFHGLVSAAVLLVAIVAIHGVIPLGVLWLPLIAVPLALLVLGVGWLLSSLGVYLRDLAEAVGPATSALMFLSPVFYAIDSLPEAFRGPLALNPLAVVITACRAALIEGVTPDFVALALTTAGSAIFAWLGFACFQRLRGGFGDVL